ncbi:outer dense fiber protein 2-like isoform X2 [Photinus pyralis]|nr:outer dense fiber protein 2-like isoform X2 [Photinus pyralis]
MAENEMLQETFLASTAEDTVMASDIERTFFSEDENAQQGPFTGGDYTGYTTDDETLVAGDAKALMTYDTNIDAVVIKELEDAEQQAMETAKIIYDLKQRVAQLLSKEKMTEVEARELEEKNKQLSDQMTMFEEKTKRIQYLIDQASMFENLISARPRLQAKHNEDMLPKVIICGITENDMPKIIVCDDKKKSKSRPRTPSFPAPQAGILPQFAKQLTESYCMQEKLAEENADLEDKRYKLQEDLLDKDCTVDCLQRKLQSLQAELRLVCKENCLLSEKLNRIESCPNQQTAQRNFERSPELCQKHRKMPCGRNKGPCPADIESRLQEYSDTTQQLEKQLCQMECEVRNMQSELVAVQKERQHLEQHRKMITSAPPCLPPPCGMPCMPPPCNMGGGSPGGAGMDQQLRELREQYNRLQDDYKGKLTEVAGLRADVEKLKQNAKDAEEARKIAEDKVKEYEKDVKSFKSEKNKYMGSKEQLIEQEQQLNVAKQRFREAQDELEELRALIQDQQAQLDDYRNKYLQAQQQVEEQRRQIDMMEMENNRISEQVNLEIQRVKNQFQEKLQELTPLPDILKTTQLKLQEAQQMHLLAERNNENLILELQAYRDKAAAMANQMEKVRSDQQLGVDEKVDLQQRVQQLELKITEAEEEIDRLQKDLVRTEEVADQNEKRVQEKLHEIAQLVAQLETVREESARQVARTKDRCETVRRSMQNQIADLERQLAQSRAQARGAQKDRDDIRQKMQAQINNLNENFEDAQMRIRNLQGHVNFLKNSYTTVFPNEVGDGMDSCDCGNAF